MTINATLINLYHICKREMWLHANGIRMEHTSDTVYEGRLIGETTYPQRAEKYTEIEIGGRRLIFMMLSIKSSTKSKKAIRQKRHTSGR